jgi:RecB family exonuclease
VITIGNSEIATWDRCRRKWFVQWYLGYVPAHEPATSNMKLGSRIHTALEGWAGTPTIDPLTVLAILYGIEIEQHPEEEAELRKEWDLAQAMAEGYIEWIASEGKDAGYRVVAAEADLQVPLPGYEDSIMLRSRLDQVVLREADGALMFKDYKTGAGLDRGSKLALDPQMRMYSMMQQLSVAGRENPPLVTGGMIDQIRRVKRTGRSNPPYFQRDEFRYNPAQITSTRARVTKLCLEIDNARGWLDDIYRRGGDLREISWFQESELRPTPIPDRCDWECPLAHGLCTMMDDGSDWPGYLRSGSMIQQDPYDYYRNDALQTVREKLAKL